MKTKTIRTSAGIEIEGLSGFTRALRAASDSAPEAMRRANFQAADTIAQAARAKASALPGVAGKAARSLRATKTTGYAAVTGGGARYPYFFGAEFGSKRYGQFQPWRGNRFSGWSGGPGYFLHPSIREKGPQVIEGYMREVDKITAQAFPD